ncbi:MAG: hypothetical protein ACI4EO_09690 [Blautia sp.]
MKMNKILAVVTAAVVTFGSVMTVYAAEPVNSGGDIVVDPDQDNSGLTDEEKELWEKGKTDTISATGEDGQELITFAFDYNKVYPDEVKEMAKLINTTKAPGNLAGMYDVTVLQKDGSEYTGKVTLTFRFDTLKANDKVTITHYMTDKEDALTGEIEYITPDSVKDGSVTATFTHLSPIGVVIQSAEDAAKKPASVTKPTTTKTTATTKTATKTAAKTTAKKSPKTGNEDFAVAMVLSGAVLCIMTVISRKKNRA